MVNPFRMQSEEAQLFCTFLWPFRRTRCAARITFAVLLIPILLAGSALGQNYLTSTGSPAFSAQEPVELGFVDASDGNLHLSIPLGSYPQRGGQAQPIVLEYDSNIWAQEVVGSTPTWEPNNGPGMHELAGWYPSYLAANVNNLIEIVQNCWTDWYWPDQSGTTHVFHVNESLGTGCPTSGDALASDSSGYHLFVNTSGDDNPKVYAPDGTLVYQPSVVEDSNGNFIQREDSNGNYMSVTNSALYGQIDTLGRQIASGSPYVGSSGITVTTSQGTSLYSFTTSTINVNSNFQQPNVQDTSTQIGVLRSLTLPDAAHSTYYFTYDCDESSGNSACGSPAGQSAYYGELISITLPTGGTISYSYTNFIDAYNNYSRWVHTRSTATGRWVYAATVQNSCSPNQFGTACQQQTTVISPTSVTTYNFELDNGAWPITIEKQDLSLNVLSTVTNTWDFSQACVTINCYGHSFIRLLSEKTTIPSSAGSLSKQTSYSYDSPQYGNKTAIQEWGYIPSSSSFASVPDRATYLSYLYYTGTDLNNVNRPQSVTLCNNSGSDSACPGGGTRVSQTLYTYDASGLTSITGVTQHDDSNFGASYTTRGNATSVSRWVSGSTYLTTSYTYDTTGQVSSETDPAQNVTHYYYSDKFYTDAGNGTTPSSYTPQNPTNAYVTSETDAIGTQTMGYYWGSGKSAVSADYNNQSTYSHYQDNLDRQTEEIDPIGWSLATYSSAAQSDMYTAVADASPSTGCASCQHTQTVLDSYGRTSSQSLVNNPIGAVEIDSTYDSDGRLIGQTHPYSGAGDPNHVSETFGYDAQDRQISTTHPDGEAQQVAYGPNIGSQGVASQQGSTTAYGYGYPQVSQDESGNRRQQWLDGLGRIIEVDEPNASGTLTSSPLVTNYLYDAGDHLTEVIQGGQTRTFQYDGLGRKTYENTPEGGTVTYAYTTSSGTLCSGDSSNVCQRTDARGVVSTYTYNNANQLIGIAYTIPGGENISSMPNVCTTANGSSANVCYFYGQGGAAAHAIGRLTEMVDSTGSESYTVDANGRVTQLSKVINSQTYNIGYQYDAGGDVTQITYPSGRIVQQAYNAVGQLCEIGSSVSGCGDSTYYAGGFSYNAPGKLTGFTYGNGVKGTFLYSPDRTQLVYLAYTKGNSTYFSLQYSYCQNSQYSPQCPNGTGGNNGSIQCITDNMDTGRSVNYSYDPLMRMTSAKTCGSSAFPQWGLAESYDRFGNRLSQTMTAGSGPSANMSFNGNNQPTGYTYDPSGNMTVEPVSPPNQMAYDGENRMATFQGFGGGASYSYDGNGLRVVKAITGGMTTVSIFSGSSVIAEYDNGAAPSSPSREYVYGGAGLLAMISGGATTYYHQDHLSVRLITDASGNVLTQQGAFPFGEQWYQSGSANNWLFTSYDRDSESGLDYALARYYDSRTGTFCSADPLAGDPSDPQSWNRYPYGRNDPIDMTDPSGKSWWSSLLIDIGIGVASAFLGPELLGAMPDPVVMSEVGADSSGAWGGTISTIFYNGEQIGQTSQDFFDLASVGGAAGGASGSWSVGLALAKAAVASQPKKPTTPQTPKKNCPPVPPRPKGADVDANIRATEAANAADPTGNGAKLWWVNQVKTGGVWDYKLQTPDQSTYDDFGNFNYGATGAVFTNSFNTLTNGAVFARLMRNPLKQLKNNGFSNPSHKNDMIRQGMQYKQNNCGKF